MNPGQTYLVYILCIDNAPSRPYHYVGITTPLRLRARMHEHASGRGAWATAQARARGLPLHLVHLLFTSDPRDEANCRRLVNTAFICPRCHHGLTVETFRGSSLDKTTGSMPEPVRFATNEKRTG